MLTIEVCARIDDRIKYDAPFLGHYSSNLLKSTDSEGINRNVPNSQFEKWAINELGFRGPDITHTKPEGITRIVCMGTSETFGLYESPGKEWVSQLTDILGEPHRFQVINTSVVGLSLKQYNRYIEKYVLKIEPDIIILYINPFGYAVGVDNFDKRQTEPPNNTNNDDKEWEFSVKHIISNLRMFPKIKQTIKGIIPMQTLKRYRLWNMKRQLRKLEHTHLNDKKPRDVVSKENLNTFRNDLRKLIRFLCNQEIDVILVSYPALISPENIEKYSEVFLDHRRFYIDLSIAGILDASYKFNNVIKTLAFEHGTGFVDIDSLIPKNIQYFADNVHYTNEGAELVALHLSNYIKNKLFD
ncbi:MAG: hypothetical protein SV375_18820 [Thermodesulfobacteriota bacterium]|nr:hypothetical protein [Thermodesulfobacteriota bacterium]